MMHGQSDCKKNFTIIVIVLLCSAVLFCAGSTKCLSVQELCSVSHKMHQSRFYPTVLTVALETRVVVCCLASVTRCVVEHRSETAVRLLGQTAGNPLWPVE